MVYLNYSCLEKACPQTFRSQQPYPWVNLEGTLTSEGYALLREALPDLSLFEKHVGKKRAFGQGYQDRYLLHYRPGLPIPSAWKEFIEELQGSTYRMWIRRMFGLPIRKTVILTMEWYFAWQGSAVPPHCDARRKLGTHLFYLNTHEDWEDSWGGQILLLDDHGKWPAHSGPGFDDLDVSVCVDPRGNGSLLFMRTEHSWHGVRPLACPADVLRKLFIVTINIPTLQVLWRRLRGKDPDGYRIQKWA